MSISTMKLLPLGDSLTQGSPDFPGGYRGVLARLFRAAGAPVELAGSRTDNSAGMDHPGHEGHPGFRIDWLRTGRRTEHSFAPPIDETLARHRPDAVLLLAGTNNLYFDPPAVAVAEMRRLIEAIHAAAPAATVYLGTLPAIAAGPKPWGSVVPADVDGRVREFNRGLARLADEVRSRGGLLVPVDTAGCARGPEDFLADGVHPTAAALERMAERWFQALRL